MSRNTEAANIPPATAPPTGVSLRLILFAIILILTAVSAYVLLKTPLGSKLKDRQFVLGWVHHHRLAAPLVIIGVYVLFSVLMLPVLQIQLAAGYAFGLTVGILWCEIGAGLGGVLALLVSRSLVGAWFQSRFESRMTRLHDINEKLGHNGLLVVMGVRLCHLLAFGLSNYLFGLTRITVIDVIIGTLLGGLPAVASYVIIGAGYADDWRCWTAVGVTNVILIIPLGLRYLRPQWFKRIGIE
jgi:uncharacterized membrane protein YdjX (TVP38/TMEM64 family)